MCPSPRIEDGPDKDKGVKCGDVEISYWMIQQDVRRTVDWIHNEVGLKFDLYSFLLLPLCWDPFHTTHLSGIHSTSHT